MVAAFEQSLSSMTSRLHQLSNSSELKDCELDRLRKTIESLKQQGGTLVDAAKSRTMSHLESSKCRPEPNYANITPVAGKQRQLRSVLIRRHTFNNGLLDTNLSLSTNTIPALTASGTLAALIRTRCNPLTVTFDRQIPTASVQ